MKIKKNTKVTVTDNYHNHSYTGIITGWVYVVKEKNTNVQLYVKPSNLKKI